jgi:hypothetical protein
VRSVHRATRAHQGVAQKGGGAPCVSLEEYRIEFPETLCGEDGRLGSVPIALAAFFPQARYLDPGNVIWLPHRLSGLPPCDPAIEVLQAARRGEPAGTLLPSLRCARRCGGLEHVRRETIQLLGSFQYRLHLFVTAWALAFDRRCSRCGPPGSSG